MSLKFIVDDNIPFIKGRLEPFAEVVYTDQFGFTPELIKGADALIIRTRTRCDESLLKDSSVKLIATATIGMDQIDLEYCNAKKIIVRNSPGCNAPAVAQYVWSALLRKGFDYKNSTLGVIGCGNVGSIVTEWCGHLGTRVLVNDPPKFERGELNFEHKNLPKLLSNADAVTIHAPLIKGGGHPTFHLIGAKELSLMKRGAILVNAARGPVINTPDVVDALKKGKIRAIIDTWEGEPVPDKNLLKMADYATFHIAGYSLEGKQRATRMVLESVAETFGISPDLSGLAPDYTPKESLSAQEIIDSYDPEIDTAPLRENPEQFDILRRNYNFREEV